MFVQIKKVSALKMALTLVLTMSLAHPLVGRAEDWKGPTAPESTQLGAMTGLGLVGGQAGLALIGQASKRIVERGFVPDLNNSVWFEIQAGWILGITGGNPFGYSAHLRWDFTRNDQWTLYAITGFGGLSGNGMAPFYPRTAIGAAMNLTSASPMQLRFEFSQTWTTVGVSWLF